MGPGVGPGKGFEMVFAVFMALATVVAFFEMFFTGQSPEEAFAMVEWS